MTPALAGFAAAGAFLLYVLFGYPLLLGWLARVKPKPVRRAPCTPPVTVVIAVHNGAAFLEGKLESILALDYPRDRVQVLVASDGSTDATAEIAARFEPHGIVLLRLPRRGKAAALNGALAQARGDIVVLTDVRQRLAPDSLRMLVENFSDPEVGAASAELVILRGDTEELANVGLYWKYEVWIRLRLSEIDSIFGATGAYYALRRELIVALPEDTLLDDMYLPLAGFFRGYRLIVDRRARMFDYPTGLSSEFRRKVRTLAGNYQILRHYPGLLGPANRLWFHYLSYKFARLLLPFALIAVLVCSVGLPRPWNLLLVAAQALFYGVAAADRYVADGSPVKRVSAPVRTFVTLMAASLCAVSILFRPSAALWKTTQVSGAPGTR